MSYVLSKKSLARLEGVHPDLVAVVKKAIKLTTVDFTVTEGLRTKERQAQLVASGASRTMNSKHLTGHAVDLAAWVDGQVRWDWPLYFKIADAMRQAAWSLGVKLRWGGTWERIDNTHAEIATYMLHRTFPDGPHFELI